MKLWPVMLIGNPIASNILISKRMPDNTKPMIRLLPCVRECMKHGFPIYTMVQ